MVGGLGVGVGAGLRGLGARGRRLRGGVLAGSFFGVGEVGHWISLGGGFGGYMYMEMNVLNAILWVPSTSQGNSTTDMKKEQC